MSVEDVMEELMAKLVVQCATRVFDDGERKVQEKTDCAQLDSDKQAGWVLN